MVRAGVSVVALDTSWDTGVCLKPLAVRLNALCVASQWQSRPLPEERILQAPNQQLHTWRKHCFSKTRGSKQSACNINMKYRPDCIAAATTRQHTHHTSTGCKHLDTHPGKSNTHPDNTQKEGGPRISHPLEPNKQSLNRLGAAEANDRQGTPQQPGNSHPNTEQQRQSCFTWYHHCNEPTHGKDQQATQCCHLTTRCAVLRPHCSRHAVTITLLAVTTLC